MPRNGASLAKRPERIGLRPAAGALAMVQARLDYLIQNRATAGALSGGSAADPWWGVDSVFSGTFYVDSVPVMVQARDLGEKLNLNSLTEDHGDTVQLLCARQLQRSRPAAQCIMIGRIRMI